MASRQATTRSYSRRFAWLAAAIVVVVAAYTGAWFYAAGMIETRIGEAMQASGGDAVPRCERPSARGYPFRIGVFCDAVAFEDARGEISVRAGAFRSAAQVYDPFHSRAQGEWQNFQFQFTRLNLGKVQNVIDDAQKRIATALDNLGKLLLLLR